MNKKSKNISIDYFLLGGLAIIFWDAVFNKTSGGNTSIIIVLSIILPFIPSVFKKGILSDYIHAWKFTIPLITLCIYYAIHPSLFQTIVTDHEGRGGRIALYILMCLISYLAGCAIVALGGVRKKTRLLILLLALCAAVWTFDFNQSSAYGFALTKNTVIGVIFHAIFLSYFSSIPSSPIVTVERLRRKTTFLYITLPYLLAFLSAFMLGQRSLAGGAAVALIVCLFAFKINYKFLFSFITLSGAILLGILFIYMVSNFNNFSGISEINELFIEFSGRRANSGRELLWSQTLYFLEKNQVFGLGVALIPPNIIETTLTSVHNSFLQVAAQVGLVGLVILIAQVAIITFIISTAKSNIVYAFGISYIVVVIFHASFEAFLSSSNFPIASIVWMNMGVLVKLSLKRDGSHENQR
ncbi:O-antigen ligase family protein [Pannonibacter phragmitetus]|uniref:O-antigen ligase family protein n=1 Tax=Pannonibacter phragmitetus TaxID=121719 RepID=UPI000F014979|nr:O-antigen ligase family protein [Pannonibacter phragmitetus]